MLPTRQPLGFLAAPRAACASLVLVLALPFTLAKPAHLHEATTAKLKEQFHFAPAAPPTETASASTNDPDSVAAPAVVLERLTVVQSFARRQLEHAIEGDQRRAAAQRFNWKDGGTLKEFRQGRLQLGLWPTAGGLNFLKFQW